MDNKFRYFLIIGLFPVIIFCYTIKFIFNKIKNKLLNKYIKSFNIGNIDSLDGYSFEEFIYYFFISIGLKVEKTSKSRDYGADLIVFSKKEKVVIQCKNYYKHNIGNSAVQEIATAKNYYNADYAVVITNWFFTTPAHNLAQKVGVRLIDRNCLVELLNIKSKNEINRFLGVFGYKGNN